MKTLAITLGLLAAVWLLAVVGIVVAATQEDCTVLFETCQTGSGTEVVILSLLGAALLATLGVLVWSGRRIVRTIRSQRG